MAHDADYEIDWSAVVGDEKDGVSRLAVEEMDLSALEEVSGHILCEYD